MNRKKTHKHILQSRTLLPDAVRVALRRHQRNARSLSEDLEAAAHLASLEATKLGLSGPDLVRHVDKILAKVRYDSRALERRVARKPKDKNGKEVEITAAPCEKPGSAQPDNVKGRAPEIRDDHTPDREVEASGSAFARPLIDALPAMQRAAVLALLEGRTIDEAAARLGVTRAQYRYQLEKATPQLQRTLAKMYEEGLLDGVISDDTEEALRVVAWLALGEEGFIDIPRDYDIVSRNGQEFLRRRDRPFKGKIRCRVRVSEQDMDRTTAWVEAQVEAERLLHGTTAGHAGAESPSGFAACAVLPDKERP